MTAFEAALSAWIAFHSALGVNIEATFLPPATESELVAAEQAIGFPLPDDLRSLYKIANGQYDVFGSTEELKQRLEPEEYWAPLFGFYRLLPLSEAVGRHIAELGGTQSYSEYVKKQNEANPEQPNSEVDITWDVREGDPVDPRGWNPSWFIFGEGGADNIAIDINPLQGGVPGQVVEFGPDVAKLSVLGSSVTDLMEVASNRLDPTEAKRYNRDAADEDSVATVFFDIDWRNKPYDEQAYLDSIPVFPAEYQQWEEENNRKAEQAAQHFIDWLKKKGLEESDSAGVSQLQRSNLKYVREFAPMPEHVFQAMNEWSLARGGAPIPGSPPADAINSSADNEKAQQLVWYRYLMGLVGEVFISSGEPGKHVSSSRGKGVLRTKAIKLINQYYLDSGVWTRRQHKSAKAFVRKIVKLKIGKKGELDGYSMSVEGSTLEISYSILDLKTYKTEEFVEKIDFKKFPRD